MATLAPAADTGEESLIILQSLLCLLREKNILSRADIEELCRKVEARTGPLSCCDRTATAARDDMHRLGSYIGRQYGGKHLRG
jgi:hypothetical protein